MIATAATVLMMAAGIAPTPADAVKPPNAERSYVARIVQSTVARAEPRADARSVGRVHTVAPWNQSPMQLWIEDVKLDEQGEIWYRVLLAKKPNGSYGWIPADYAQARLTRWRVAVDISSRRMTIFRDGRAVKSARVVVGARSTPTPVGQFAIREVVRQPDPDGFSGPYIFHLNANSQKLKSFDGGDGVIGIHGRGGASLNDPLGSARSHGCVRVQNRLVRFMAKRIVAGTPVLVRR